MFKKNRKKYNILSNYGRVFNCRICEFKKQLTQDEYVLFNFSKNQYEIKKTIWKRLKEYLS